MPTASGICRWLILALCAWLACSGRSRADTPAARDFQIAPQALASALVEFSKQADMQVLGATEAIQTLRTLGVVGHFTVDQALEQLLRGTELGFRKSGQHTVTIASRAGPPPSSSNAASERSMVIAEAHSAPGSSLDSARVDAGSSEPVAPNLTEIIVTAQKREERLQDVPIPVTVITGDELVNSHQLRLQDYYTTVPGLSVTPDDARGTPTLSIRGITTGGYTNPTVGITVDDVPYGSSTNLGGGYAAPDIDPSDLARVEVLRGPQGTLYGASSLGGLLKFVTVDPSTAGVSGRIQADVDHVYNGDGAGYGLRGAVNVPITEDLAVRASAFTRRDAGYIDDPIHHLEGVNREDVEGARLSALWRPSSTISLKLSALYQDVKRFGSPDVDLQSGLGDLQQNNVPGTGSLEKKTQAYSATFSAKWGIADLTAISGYSVNELTDSIDYSAALGGAGGYTDTGIPGTSFIGFGVTGAPLVDHNKTSKFTEEVRLSMPLGSRVDWLAGVFYTHEKSPYVQDALAANFTTGEIVGSLGEFNFPTTYEEYAAFTDLTVHFTDRFDIQFGGRESQNRQSYSEVDSGPLTGLAIQPEIDTKDSSFTYLVTPRLRFSPDLMLYARLASGYRPGGPNPTCTIVGAPCEYGPDKTTNYELGVKADLLNHVLSLDASVYYIDWKDIQLTLVNPIYDFTYFANAGRAKSKGVELSTVLRPVGGLQIAAWVSFNDAQLSEALPPGAAGLAAVAASGDRLPDSSRFSGNLAVTEEFILTGRLSGFVSADLSYVGEREGEFTPVVQRQTYPAYAKTDLRVGGKYDSWTANLFVTNLADKRGLLGGGFGSAPNPLAINYIQPRTIGLSLSKSF